MTGAAEVKQKANCFRVKAFGNNIVLPHSRETSCG